MYSTARSAKSAAPSNKSTQIVKYTSGKNRGKFDWIDERVQVLDANLGAVDDYVLIAVSHIMPGYKKKWINY